MPLPALRFAGLATMASLSVLAACGDAGSRASEPPGTAATRRARSMAGVPTSADHAALDSITRVADAMYGRGAYDSARTAYDRALASASALGEPAAAARILTSLGLAAWRRGDYPEARRLGDSALAIKHRRELRPDLFRSYNALGLLARDEGRLVVAQAFFDSALAAAREFGDRLNEAKVTSNLALVAYDLGDLESARAGFIGAQAVARAEGDVRTDWNATVSLASVDVRLGNALAAIEAVEALRRRYPTPNHPVGEENAFGQLATAYDLLGESQRAIAALDTAIRMARAADLPVQEAEDLKLLAEIYEKTGDRRRALSILDEAIRLDSVSGATDEVADVLVRRAAVLGALGDASRARASAARALDLHRGMGATLDVVGDLLVDAELAARAGRHAEARGRLAAAASLAEGLHVPALRASLALTAARLADERGNPRAVLRALEPARADLVLGGVVAEAEGDALAARAHQRLGQLNAAVARGRLAVAGLERIRTSLGLGELRTAFVADRAAIYADLVMALLQLGRTAEALEVADGARSRALLDHIAEARLRGEDTASASTVLAERARLLRRIDALLSRLAATDAGRPRERGGSVSARQSAVIAELAAARREFDELLVRHSATQPHAGLSGAAERVDTDAVRRSLRDDEALLEFFVAQDRTLIFLVRRDGVRVLVSPVSSDDLAGRVRLARDFLAQPGGLAPPDPRGDAVLRALHRVLIGPVAASGRLAGIRRLIIVPHAALAYLPFAALRSSTGRVLVQDYTILYLPVAAALQTLRAVPAEASPRLPIVAFAPFPTTLTSSRDEARQAAAPHTRSTTLIGGVATERAVRAALQSGAMVHVASHGVMESESPMFSRIELARGSGVESDNGRLEVHELLALRVRSPLVFLSGCETGVGEAWSSRYTQVDDHATLAQAFLYAGARTVIATQWRVEDESAAAVASRFYAHFAGGAGDAADALAAAQRAIMRDRRFGSPHYWAAYTVSGAGTAGEATPTAGPVSAARVAH